MDINIYICICKFVKIFYTQEVHLFVFLTIVDFIVWQLNQIYSVLSGSVLSGCVLSGSVLWV